MQSVRVPRSSPKKLPRQIFILALVVITLTGHVVAALSTPDGWWAVSWIGYAVVGGVVLLQRPGNRIGWLLLGVGLCWSIDFMILLFFEGRARAANLVWLEVISSIIGYIAWLLLVMIPVLFPSGQPTDPLTKFLQRALVVVLLVVVAAELVSDSPKELTGAVSPLALPAFSAISAFLLEDGFIIVPLLLLVSMVSLVVRWRRAVGPERLQFRWFIGSLVLVIPALIVTQFMPDESFVSIDVVIALILNLIPVAIGVAVLRYRLYEIDRIISRTVGYALVVGILGLVYVIGAVWLPSRVIGEQPDLFVAGATLVVAALFNPVRRRVQAEVDRRFYRSRYNAEKLVAGFSSAVGNQVDIEALVEQWMAVVGKTMQPASAEVWVRKEEPS